MPDACEMYARYAFKVKKLFVTDFYHEQGIVTVHIGSSIFSTPTLFELSDNIGFPQWLVNQ